MSKVYEIVTKKITSKLREGCVPWHLPWKKKFELQRNLKSGTIYKGINTFLTLMEEYNSPYWLTFKQVQEMGGKVKSKERATPIVFWKFINKEDEETGEDKSFPLLRYYTVFNVVQCDNIKGLPKIDYKVIDFNPIEKAELIISNMVNRPPIKYQKQKAYYNPNLDTVNMPLKESFNNEEEYYSTLFHEIVHSTGHKARLNRKDSSHNSYSKEELIAEIGSSFLCAEAGITKTFDNSAAYINEWLKKLGSDHRLIIQASSAAQKAVEYILGTNNETEVNNP